MLMFLSSKKESGYKGSLSFCGFARGVDCDVGSGGCGSANTVSLVLVLFPVVPETQQMINFALFFLLCANSVALLQPQSNKNT